jgi:DNA excision repair protein ERCC-3
MNNYTIITFLKENRGQELSLEDVEKGTGLKISSSPQLLQNLKENPSINHREDVSSGKKVVMLSWRSKYPITSKETLLAYLQQHKLLEIDAEVKLCYKDIMTDLEQMTKEKRVFVIFLAKNKPIYFINEAPQYRPMDEQIMQLWEKTFTEGTSDMVGIRQQLQHRYRVPLAQLPFDEDFFILQQIKEKKVRDEKLKALKRKGKGRTVGPNVKKKVNETLSDMNFSLTIAGATDGADVFTLKSEQDEVIELTAEDEKGNAVEMPKVPEDICDFVQRMIRAFCDDESIVAFEALLREVSQEANVTSINERKETLLADKLHLSPRILRTILGRLKTQCFARERIFTLPSTESTRATKQYSCWLITFNDLFDITNYRILKMLDIIDSSSKDDSHYLYFCSNKACGRKYGIEDVGLLFGQQSCLDCQSELINAETNKKQDEWSNVRPVLEELKDQIRAILLRSGSTMGNTPELSNSSAASRRLPSSRQRKRGGGPATPRTPSSSSSTSTTATVKSENGSGKDSPAGPSMDLVRKGEEKLAFDHPTPIQIARDGRIWLSVVYKTWVKKDPATARAREAKKETVLAALLGGDEEGLLGKKKRKSGEKKEKESKRPKREDGMDLIQVKQERSDDAEAELPSQLKVLIKSEPSVKLESITKEESADIDRKLNMERTMSADEIRIDTEMKHREKREVGWDWSYSTKQAHNFLCHVSELRKYYSQVLEYEVTTQSLYLAWKHLGITPIEVARRLAFMAGLKDAKELPRSIMQTVAACSPGPDGRMKNYYTVKLVLKDGEYYVESHSPSILNIIQQRVLGQVEMSSFSTIDEETGAEVLVYALPISTVQEVAEIKKLLLIHNHPFIEEFDFLTNRWSEKACANLAINLKEGTGVRPYQMRAAFSLFWDNKAHSSILVLPCGAGKTLVGITVSSIIKKCILVFCTSMMAVNQWREQFLKWSDIEPNRISRFISDTRKKGEWDHTCGLLITTYNMFTSEKRAEHSTRMIEKCKERTWGLMILDEVHLAPATTFKRVTTEFRAHVKLGLTATMVREDELIAELPTLVGPRLDEVDLLSLKIHNHVANVHCYRIVCPLTSAFGSAYRTARSPAEKRLLHITNPNKARIVFTLLKRHLRRGHKCLVFCDDLFGLQWFSQVLGSPYIDGETKNEDREKSLNMFRTTKSSAYVLISKVGDHSIDLPEANVVIQVGVVDGSRMQEAQRLGRVQRKKPGTDVTAYFYTIVSEGTDEVGYSDRRREFMEEHGYLYHEYDYKHFMHAETEEFTRDSKQDNLLAAIRQEMEKNPEGRSEYSELDDRPTKRESKKKGTTRQRLNKIVNKRTGGREARE